MPTTGAVKLDHGQKELLRSLELPTDLSTDMGDKEWFAVTDRLEDELQLHGINDTGDGTNKRGDLCVSILDAMAEADSEKRE